MNTFLKENFFKLLIGSSILILSIAVLIYIVTATQTPPSANDKIIGEPIKIADIEVAEYDFPEYMNWDNALKACKALGSGWRLPTTRELDLLYRNKDEIGSFAPEYYWSSNFFDVNSSWRYNFHGGFQAEANKGFGSNVRAVRSF